MPVDVRILLTVGFPLFFVALWCGISLLASRLGGWHRLSRSYAVARAFAGTRRRRFCSVSFRPATNYGFCTTIGIEEVGLWLSVLPIFRLGHPPLLIPWSDLTATPARVWGTKAVELTFEQAPGVIMIMSSRTFERAVGSLDRAERNATIT